HFLHDVATTDRYPLSLPDALPICQGPPWPSQRPVARSMKENIPKPCTAHAPGCCRNLRQADARGSWPPIQRAATGSPTSSAKRSKSSANGGRTTTRSVWSLISVCVMPGPPCRRRSAARRRSGVRRARRGAAARRPCSERVDAGELAAHHQLVHGFGALVGDHRLHVQRVPDRAVL